MHTPTIDRKVDVTERDDGLITVSLEFRCPKRGLFYIKSETVKDPMEAKRLISNFHQMISAIDEANLSDPDILRRYVRKEPLLAGGII